MKTEDAYESLQLTIGEWFNIAKFTIIEGKTMTSIKSRIDFDDFIKVWDCECGEKK